ncbi:MAG: DUF2634 domain-containing protein [Lachnospiraceae bacterium]|nr:DUF2634 domain-containing protein [Lachnospiraceae bacterium]MDE6251167.1 DUF2634 domain-containing protein [Lachnospiraceae bacterium]
MTIVGEDNIDIKLDADGQPVPDINGDFSLVSGDKCWEQDLRLEAATEEGELFYEDEDGDEAYGFGFLDFTHAENDEFTQTEIQQRVRGKLAKRTYLDMAKTKQDVSYAEGIYYDRISVSKNDSSDEYNIELSTDEVEVESE